MFRILTVFVVCFFSFAASIRAADLSPLKDRAEQSTRDLATSQPPQPTTDTTTHPSPALRGTLRGALTIARALARWFTWAKGVADAIDELLRLLDDARASAEANKRLIELEKKLAEIEFALAQAPKLALKDNNARAFIRELRDQLSRARTPYRSCPIAQHRALDGRCKDKRANDRPIAP